MYDLQILLSSDTLYQEKLDAATNIINNYDLQLLQEEFMSIFRQARYYYNGVNNDNSILRFFEQQQFLFNTLLNTNKNLFVAITKSYICKTQLYADFTCLVYGDDMNRQIKYYCVSSDVVNTYYKLLDNNDFDVDDLDIEEEHKLLIQQYKQEKYGGKFTKATV